MTHKIHKCLSNKAMVLLTRTGVSAKNVNGSTYHSALHINSKNKDVAPLKGAAAHTLQERFEEVLFIIIDENSMVGCNAMYMIEERIQQAKGATREDLSGCFVYLFGDIKQIPPVGDTPVYSNKQKSCERLRGKMIFNNFQGAVFLSEIKRQKDASFQKVLNNVGDGNISADDYKILKSIFRTNVSKYERDKFNDAVHLYPTRLQVLAHNMERLENSKDGNNQPKPVARVPALHNCASAAHGTVDDAEGLYPILYLADEGASIMLKQNI